MDIQHVQSVHRYSNVASVLDDFSYRTTCKEQGFRISLGEGMDVDYLEPNRLIFPVPIVEVGWRNILCFRVPITATSCISFSVSLVSKSLSLSPSKNPFRPSEIARVGEKVLAGEAHLSELVDREDLTEIEDYVVLVATQRVQNRTEKLAPFDESIKLLRAHWCRATQKV